MYKFGNVLIRQTWQNAHAWVNRRHLAQKIDYTTQCNLLSVLPVTSSLSSARALEICRLDDRVSGSQGNKSRFLSTSVAREEKDLNPFNLIRDDIKDVHDEIIGMFRKHIRSTEMYNIAANYYEIIGNSVGMSASFVILLNTILNYHMFKDATLTEPQRKVIAIVEVLLRHAILHDDILDNANIRHGLPTAHKLWTPYQVICTGNMLLGIALEEASKFKNNINTTLFQMHEVIQKGQFMHFQDVMDGDLLDHYLITHDYKNASLVKYVAIATARAVGATESLVDIMDRLGFSLGMFIGVIDDIADFEEDLKNGRNSGPAIFASEEYPELEKIILRRFSEEGDVEKTIELVNKSQGFEKTRNLARKYHRLIMRYLNLLADSPYKRALENALQVSLSRMEPGKGESFVVDV